MARREDQAPRGGQSGGAARETGGRAESRTDPDPSRDRKDVAGTTDPESPQTPEPEPGTALDDATSTVTNTGPSS
jgi:hypothetical protein